MKISSLYTNTHAKCSECKQMLAHSAFAKNASRHRGLQSVCRGCFARRFQKSDPLANRKAHLRRHYGMAWDSYVEMYNAQNGRCLICETAILLYERDKLKVAHVDHDHKTGRVRALLCHYCNSGIGYFRDDPKRLEIATWYLQAQNAPPALETCEAAAEEHW